MSVTPYPTAAQTRAAYQQVMARVAQAAARSGRTARDILVVAVTKTAGADQIRLLHELGHRDFGENRVQHLTQRVAQLEEYLGRRKLLGPLDDAATPLGQSPARTPAAPVRWHMIGHLQRNKIKPVVPLVRLIHSVDSLRLAEELHTLGAKLDRVIEVLLQVNISGEESKCGLAPPALIHLAEQMDTMLHLRVRGLMTMAPYSPDPEQARPYFRRCAELFEELRSSRAGGPLCNLLSMGMSGDFEVAIEEGANLVRVGRALFGENERDPSPQALPDRPAPRDAEEETTS